MTAASNTGTSGASMPGTDYGTFDPAGDTYTQLGTIAVEGVLGAYTINGMVYGGDTGSLYYVNGSRVEGLDIATQATRASAYTGEGMFGNIGGNTASACALVPMRHNRLSVLSREPLQVGQVV